MHSRVSSEGKKTQTGTAQIYNWDLFLDVERFECLSPKTLSLPNGKGAHGHILSDFSFCLPFSIEDSVVQKNINAAMQNFFSLYHKNKLLS